MYELPLGHNALDEAVQRDDIAMVRTLLILGANPNDDIVWPDDYPVYSWNHVKSVEVAKMPVAYGGVLDAERLNNKELPKVVLEYYHQQIKLYKHR
eukprot:GILK01039394.1.p1 GENE.GILK01039394.1~~GILK01039394.1.p1  ORF type:complete len:106 (+),score=4.30 GILK01039394.1:32-319(+)